jgi:hypothetical protein
VVTCTDWLKRHPEVEVISRDRCGLYAQAARRGAPQAKQVADRFHIMQNLRQAIEEQMNLHGRATGRALLSDAANIAAAGNLLKSRLAHRTSREEIFTTIDALRNQGLTCSEIGRRTGFPRRSIAKWLQFETPPDRRRAALKLTSPWYFEELLHQSWKDGIRTGSALFRLIRKRGYEGSPTHLRRLLAGWRRAEKQAKGPALEPQILEPVRDPETGHAISPVIAAALCIKPRGKLTPDQARKVDALKAGSPAFATMRCLAMRFNGICRVALYSGHPQCVWQNCHFLLQINRIVLAKTRRWAPFSRVTVDRAGCPFFGERGFSGGKKPKKPPNDAQVCPKRQAGQCFEPRCCLSTTHIEDDPNQRQRDTRWAET